MSKQARPPGRTSISRTVQVNPSGPNHWQKASASVHAANTASRVASRTRTRTISRSRAHVVGLVMDGVLLMASPMSVWMRFDQMCVGGAHRAGRDGAPTQLVGARPMRRSRPEAPAAAGTAAVVHLGRD